MSLQVWLPLNGNLNNNGIGNNTFVTYGTYSWDSLGKIGKCFKTQNTGTAYSDQPITLNKDFSISLWVRLDSIEANFDRFFGLMGANKYSNYMGLCYHASISGAVGFHIYKDSGSNSPVRVIDTYSFTNRSAGEWDHYCITMSNGNTVRLYLNGRLIDTLNCTFTSTQYKAISIGGRDKNEEIGDASINDFRIYDHCLSPREVKEISKGLVLHYPLNQPERSPNLSTLISDIPDLPRAAGDSAYSLSTDGVSRRMTCTTVGSHGRYNYCFTNEAREANTTYTWSVDIRANIPTNAIIGLEGGGTRNFNIATNWQRISMTAILTTNSYSAFIVYPHGGVPVGDWIEIKNFKVEKGSVATPWSPATADYPTWSDGIEYDTSGLNNNGKVVNSVSVVGNSPRNKVAYKFPTNAYISCGNTAKVTDEITVNIWAYMSTWENIILVSCTQGAGWNFEPNSNRISFPVYVKDVGYITAVSSNTWSELSSGWHMFTGTYDGFTVKLYVDGNLHASASNGQSAKTPIYYISNGLFIHAEASHTESSPDTGYAEMDMSDFRIYATALSAEDIKELYNAPVAITNNGLLMTQGEVVEE